MEQDPAKKSSTKSCSFGSVPIWSMRLRISAGVRTLSTKIVVAPGSCLLPSVELLPNPTSGRGEKSARDAIDVINPRTKIFHLPVGRTAYAQSPIKATCQDLRQHWPIRDSLRLPAPNVFKQLESILS